MTGAITVTSLIIIIIIIFSVINSRVDVICSPHYNAHAHSRPSGQVKHWGTSFDVRNITVYRLATDSHWYTCTYYIIIN